jgi:hypothetical protein
MAEPPLISTLSLNRLGRLDCEALVLGITKAKPLPVYSGFQVYRIASGVVLIWYSG